jgi:hypothetical protein
MVTTTESTNGGGPSQGLPDDPQALQDLLSDDDSVTGTSSSTGSCPNYQAWCPPLDLGAPASALDSSPSRGGIVFDEGDEGTLWPGCTQDLLEQVWGFLKDNRDLVKWAVCAAFGDDSVTECVVDWIKNAKAGSIHFVPAVDCLLDGTVFKLATSPPQLFGLVPPKITVCVASGGSIDLASELFCSADPAAQECAIVAIASSLVHELTHVCHQSGGDVSGNCEGSYMAGSNFAWAAMLRFTGAASSPCCAPFLNVLQGSDKALPAVKTDCLAPTGGSGGSGLNPGPGMVPKDEPWLPDWDSGFDLYVDGVPIS